MEDNIAIKNALSLIFQGISELQDSFKERKFTIDGGLVGDIGEVIASSAYDIELDEVSQAEYDV